MPVPPRRPGAAGRQLGAARVLSDETRELDPQAGNEQEYASCLVVGALLDAGFGRRRRGPRGGRRRPRGRRGDGRRDVPDPPPRRARVRRAVARRRRARRRSGSARRPTPARAGRRRAVDLPRDPERDRGARWRPASSSAPTAWSRTSRRSAARTGRPWTRGDRRARARAAAAAAGRPRRRAASCVQAVAAPRRSQPFELARTLLALGRLERRAKRKRAARDALERAAAIFAALPAPLWEAKARDRARAARRPHGARRADRDRGADRRARRRGPDEPRDRRRGVREPQDRRGQPLEGLPQARRPLARRARARPPAARALGRKLEGFVVTRWRADWIGLPIEYRI